MSRIGLAGELRARIVAAKEPGRGPPAHRPALPCGGSSAGQSNGFLNRRSRVRVSPTAPRSASARGRGGGEGSAPEGGFAGVAVALELRGDLIEGGLDHAVAGIAGEVGADGAGEGPAGPGAPAAGFAAGFVHAAGVVLEVHAGVAEEDAVGGVADDPGQRGVGERPRLEHGLGAVEFGAEGAVEAEEGAGGRAALPEGLAVLEARKVEGGVARGGAVGVERAPVEAGGRRGQMGAGGQRHREVSLAGIGAGVNPRARGPASGERARAGGTGQKAAGQWYPFYTYIRRCSATAGGGRAAQRLTRMRALAASCIVATGRRALFAWREPRFRRQHWR